MIDRLISFSIRHKLVVGIFVLALIGWGTYSLRQIPIDAVPDITTNQVQILTQAPTLAVQEVEQFVTFPIEIAMANLPRVEEIRSISRFGLSVVTVVFEDGADIYRARQLISEQLQIAKSNIPEGFGNPELGPITTGLGEVYQYVLHTAPGYDTVYTDMDLRTINDWIVKRQLAGTPGVVEVSGWGGHLKQYEVAVNPEKLKNHDISVADVFQAVADNNENTGGSYIEKAHNTYFIRGEGLITSLTDIERIVLRTVNGVPLLVRDVATVGFGSAPRYGAITYNGQGEVVGGQALMLKGENSYEVVNAVKDRMETIRGSLPEGVILEAYIDRSGLISRAIHTVTNNLVEGGLIVIFVLVLLLGNLRGGLIVASVIPLAMLFALGMMNVFGVSANLMSLGAIDFGLVVDGSVIIVEAILHRLQSGFSGKKLSRVRMDEEVNIAATRIRSSAAFGEVIILIVYLPILALVGIEGKMFRPMAQTVSFAILGALILSMTYVPMMSALFLKRKITNKRTISDRIIAFLQRTYTPVLRLALRRKALTLALAVGLFGMSLYTFNRLGGEFIPELEEGDFALHQILPPGSSLQQSIAVSEKIQRILLDEFPEVVTAVSKIGSAEVPTDPMPIEIGDIMVHMKPRDEWVTANTREEMFEHMEEALSVIPGVEYEFTQPIQMRFNELISGVREDIAIKIFGENMDVLFRKAQEAERIIRNIEGVGDLRVEQTQGLPQIMVEYQRDQIARYGLNIRDLNTTLRTAFAGETAGVVFEEERRFDLVVRLEKDLRTDIESVRNLYVSTPNGRQIPLREVADIQLKEGPMQISRENTNRRIVIGVNARNRDTESLVEEISQRLESELDLPAGYYLRYGGDFENLIAARKRLAIAVPAALFLILTLLFFTFGNAIQALMIFTAIPLSAIGGVYALWLRDMPFSISAGIGFIALFGVAVLNGIVLIAYFNQLKEEGVTDLRERILTGTRVRLRPVIMTASVAALGFLPMALSDSAGAEVQRPLATVVIGGLITATLLTMLVLPVLYSLVERFSGGKGVRSAAMTLVLLVSAFSTLSAQGPEILTADEAVARARDYDPSLRSAELLIREGEVQERTAFNPDNATVNFTYGQINTDVIDYQWQFNQRFRFPTAYRREGELREARTDLFRSERHLLALEVEWKIRSRWWQWAFARERAALLDELAQTFRDFATAAEKRYRSGASNYLEKTSAEGRYRRILLERDMAQTEAAIQAEQLRRFTGSNEGFVLPDDAFVRLDPPAAEITAGTHPVMLQYQQMMRVAEAETALARTDYLPDLNLGYFRQQAEGIPGLQGVQIGLGVPLFFPARLRKVKAARIKADRTEADYQHGQLLLNSRYVAARQQLEKRAEELAWYEEQGLETATELIRFANGAYAAGEIDYLEYLRATGEAHDIRLNYLRAVHVYNQTVLELQYLLGNF